MRIAYVGNFEPHYSTENDVREAIELLGHQVDPIQENKATIQEIRDKFPKADLILWTGTWDDVLPFKETVDLLRKCAIEGTPSATLHLDIFHSTKREGRHWWMNPMFFTGYVFTADGGHQQEWEAMGMQHYWLRPGIRHSAAKTGVFTPEFECDIAFVGSNGQGYHEDVWPYRKELVNQLRDMCRRNGWTWRNPGGDEPKIDRDDRMNNFYASAKITVGDSLCIKKEESKYCSDRVYEATGRGGFLIMPEIEFLKDDFIGLLPQYGWGNFGQLEDTIKFWLENDTTRKTVQRELHKITQEKHTYKNRVAEMLSTIEAHRNGADIRLLRQER